MSKLQSNCIALAVRARLTHGAAKVREIVQCIGYKRIADITDAQDLIELENRLKQIL